MALQVTENKRADVGCWMALEQPHGHSNANKKNRVPMLEGPGCAENVEAQQKHGPQIPPVGGILRRRRLPSSGYHPVHPRHSRERLTD